MNNPDIKLGMIAYLGLPINFPNGTPFGTICILDRKEKHFSEKEEKILFQFKTLIESDLAQLYNIKTKKHIDEFISKIEQTYYNVFNTLSEAVYIQDSSGRFIDVNQGAANIYQCSREDLIGLTPLDVSAPGMNDLEETQRLSFEVFESGTPAKFEFWALRKNGEVFSKDVIVNKGTYFGKDVLIVTARDTTEKKAAEETLRKNEERFRTIFKYAPIGIIQFDKDSKIIDVNERFVQIMNSSREKLIGLNMLKSIPNPKSVKAIEKALLGEASAYDDLYKSFTGGREFYLSAQIVPLFDAENHITGGIGIFEDITEKKIAKKKLEESEETYRNIFHNAQVGLFRTRISDGKIIECNEKLATMLGFDFRKEVIENFYTIDNYVYPDHRNIAIEKLKKEGNINNFETAFYRKDKSIIWISMSAHIYLERGWIEGVAEDITERINYQEMQKRQFEFSKALNKISETIIYSDETETILEQCNKIIGEVLEVDRILIYRVSFGQRRINSLCEWLRVENENIRKTIGEYSSLDMFDMAFTQISEKWEYLISYLNQIHPSLIGTPAEILHNQLNIKSLIWYPFAFDLDGYYLFTINHIEKEHKWQNDEIDFLETAAKQISIALIKISLLENRKQSEEELKEKNYQLENQYEEYSQLNEVLRKTNQDLEIAKSKAEESDKLKTAFLQNMSHEIRTPLNGILGFTGLLTKKDISNDEIEEFTTVIEHSSRRLLELVNNVLDIAKIETGQMNMRLDAFSVNSLITNLYSFFYQSAVLKGIELSFELGLSNENSIIYSDETKLHQVLSNLINNSMKFTKNGKINFGYSITGERIIFFVKDTGIGISKEHQAKIFDRFTQVDLSITRGNEGAGLGLAICKGIIEALGGRIWVESEYSKGTTFYFEIPLLRVDLKLNDFTEFNETEIIAKMKILIAEDDPVSVKYLQRILVDDKIELLFAENGQEAVDIVNQTPDLDLILMDIRMPIMDGIQAAEIIRKLKPELPIIAQTAFAYDEEKEMILTKGFDDYLSKPINEKQLTASISRVTDRKDILQKNKK